MTKKSLCKILVFDLDDTLYKEVDYLRSAYQTIAATCVMPGIYHQMLDWYATGEDVFQRLIDQKLTSVTKDELLRLYRIHQPDITLSKDTKDVLERLKACPDIRLGLMTDGRALTQTHKIEALHLYDYIAPQDIIISEIFGSAKPSVANYRYFMKRYPQAEWWYIGDNTDKDFITANELGWLTICLKDNGQNIHQQQFSITQEKLPQKTITDLSELIELLSDRNIIGL